MSAPCTARGVILEILNSAKVNLRNLGQFCDPNR